MRRFALLVALVLAIGIVPVASATSSLSIGTPGYDSSVIKSDTFSVTAAVTASGVGSTITVTATLQDNTGSAVTIQSAEQVKTYESNTSQTFTWTVTADDPGTYSDPFKVTATANDGGTATPKTATTVLTIKDKPVLELTLTRNQTTVETGDSVRLDYTIANRGSDDAADATDTNVSLSLPIGWSLTSGTTSYNPGTITPGASKSGNWIVTADSPNSTNTLTATATSTVPGGTVVDSCAINTSSSQPGSTPPAPVSLANTTGNYWVNYTWSAGSGVVTDSYNVSLNGTWTNGTTATFLNTSVGSGGWANITVWAYNASGNGNLSASGASDNVQAPTAADTTPPTPVSLANTTGNYWVNYTWSAGSGVVTDSYNVSLNGTWTNGTTATFLNTSVGSGGWANITVWAYNASGNGNLSASGASDNVQAPSETVNVTILLNAGWNLIGIPVTPTNATVASVFDGVTMYGASVYRYGASGYEAVTTVAPKSGYWVYSASSKTITVEGTVVTS